MNDDFQKGVYAWVMSAMGQDVLWSETERNRRFIEEALELVQACGMPKDDAFALVEYVYSRPKGEKSQEVGGVMITLSALCSVQNINLIEAAETEYQRIWNNIDKIRKKHNSKPDAVSKKITELNG